MKTEPLMSWLKQLMVIVLPFYQKVPGSSTTESSCWSVAALRWPRLLRKVCRSFQGWPVLPPETPLRGPKMESYWITTTSQHLRAAILVCSHLRETLQGSPGALLPLTRINILIQWFNSIYSKGKHRFISPPSLRYSLIFLKDYYKLHWE